MADGKIQMPVQGVDGNTLDFFRKGGSTSWILGIKSSGQMLDGVKVEKSVLKEEQELQIYEILKSQDYINWLITK